MQIIVFWIIGRLLEPSSHAGVAAIAQGLKYFMPPSWAPVADAASGLFGALAVALSERGRRDG